VIEAFHLSKSFGDFTAVSDVSFRCGRGEVVGFLGPNGAGKTTTIRMLAGYLVPSSGKAEIAGVDVGTHSLEARRLIGYLPETVPLYKEMTVFSYLKFMAQIRGVRKQSAEERVEAIADVCGLSNHLHLHIGKLSKGFRQRVGLAQAIVHDPPVLILDEPTSGIDPIQIVQTKQLIRELGRNRTVLVSSHVLPVVRELCDRAIILKEGSVVVEDSIEGLLASASNAHRFELEIMGPTESIRRVLQEIIGVEKILENSPYWTIECLGDEDFQAEIYSALAGNELELVSSRALPVDLEDIFLDLTTAHRSDD